MDTRTLAARSGLKDYRDYFGIAGPSTIDIRQTDRNNSDAAVIDTLAVMAGHVNRTKTSPQVVAACRDAGITNDMSEAEILNAVFRYIKSHVQFASDESQLADLFAVPDSKELLITPPVLLTMRQPRGDCDDFAMLSCAMLMQWGITCSFKTVAADAGLPNQFTHVYSIVGTHGTPFDPSYGSNVGWETEKRYREMVWPVLDIKQGTNRMITGMRGLGDEGDTGNVDITLADVQAMATPGDYVLTGQNYGSSNGGSGFSWSQTFANLLPGVFGAGEKIALQTTQKPGYQQVGPNGSISYVAGGNQSGMNIPGLQGSGGGSLLPLLIIGGIGLAVYAVANSKKA